MVVMYIGARSVVFVDDDVFDDDVFIDDVFIDDVFDDDTFDDDTFDDDTFDDDTFDDASSEHPTMLTSAICVGTKSIKNTTLFIGNTHKT